MSNPVSRYLAERRAAAAKRDADETAALEAVVNAAAKKQAGYFPMPPTREFVAERVNEALQGLRSDLRLQTLRLTRLGRLCGREEMPMGVAHALTYDLDTIGDTAFRRFLGEVIITAVIDDLEARAETVRMWRALCRHYGPGGWHLDEEPITLFESSVRGITPVVIDDQP